MTSENIKRSPVTVIFEDNEKVVNDFLIFAAQRELAVNAQSVKFVLEKIETDGRKG